MSAAEHLQEAIDVGCTRDDHDHVGDHRAEVLAEAANVAESLRHFERQYSPAASGAQVSENVGILRVSAELRRMAGKDTSDAIQAPAGESTQPASEPLAIRWDRLVIHPDADPTEPTIVCCIAANTGQPVALFLDDEHREALGLLLVDPDGDDEVYADVPDDETTPEPAANRTQLSTAKLRALLAGGQPAAPVAPPRFTDTSSGEWVRCSSSHCPNCERYDKATGRGWVNGHTDSWHCPDHAARAIEGEVSRG